MTLLTKKTCNRKIEFLSGFPCITMSSPVYTSYKQITKVQSKHDILQVKQDEILVIEDKKLNTVQAYMSSTMRLLFLKLVNADKDSNNNPSLFLTTSSSCTPPSYSQLQTHSPTTLSPKTDGFVSSG